MSAADRAALDDWARLAEAWANVMDGRRVGTGLNAARINGDTTTADDWHAIAAEYARLSREDRPTRDDIAAMIAYGDTDDGSHPNRQP